MSIDSKIKQNNSLNILQNFLCMYFQCGSFITFVKPKTFPVPLGCAIFYPNGAAP